MTNGRRVRQWTCFVDEREKGTQQTIFVELIVDVNELGFPGAADNHHKRTHVLYIRSRLQLMQMPILQEMSVILSMQTKSGSRSE
jgi:hypothetical protein